MDFTQVTIPKQLSGTFETFLYNLAYTQVFVNLMKFISYTVSSFNTLLRVIGILFYYLIKILF